MKTEIKNIKTGLGVVLGGLTLSSFALSANASELFAVSALGTGEELRAELIDGESATINAVMGIKGLEASCGEQPKAKKKRTKKGKEASCGEQPKKTKKKKGKESSCGEK